MLSVDEVGFAYDGGAPVLTGISLRAERGEVIAIVGRNGAGKSTLLRLLNGLLKPAAGRLTVNGNDTATTPVHVLARHIGTVFQAPEQQIFNATVHDEVAYGPRRLGLRGKALAARVAGVLERVGLAADGARHPLDLDAAGLRFVAIGSVLAMRPAILLLDEPQRGLDAPSLARLESIVAAEAAAETCVLMVCHDMDFVARRAGRVIALAGGRVCADHSAAAFFGDPRLTRRAGVELPDTLRLSAELGLPAALTPEVLASEWIARARRIDLAR
jgi:energy-coupling factor transport system ATP-binding protein